MPLINCVMQLINPMKLSVSGIMFLISRKCGPKVVSINAPESIAMAQGLLLASYAGTCKASTDLGVIGSWFLHVSDKFFCLAGT